MPGIRTHEEYESLPAIDIQWDFAMAKLESRLNEAEIERRRQEMD